MLISYPGSLSKMEYVLLDDQGTGKQFVFQNPIQVITADKPADLPHAFAEIEATQKNGKWLAGWMAYELGHALEPRFQAPDGPLICLGVFNAPEDSPPPSNWLYTRTVPNLDFKPSWSEADYLSRFKVIQDYLRAGDCYQVNLTFPMFAESDANAAEIYAAFRRRQPGRYGAVVSLGENDIVSFSPELFFERKGRHMRMRPMKGTRPRSVDPEEDSAILAQMQAEPKSRAENLMIVDLLRNDLSRLCEAGSVDVPELFALETYPTLHQMTSQVTGTLTEAVTWTNILKSLFPCGSVTGAPKIRAMEIIQELENKPRGAYCGSVGYISPTGDASFSVAIRTIQMRKGVLRYDVGSGVVLDSDGPDEYQECLLKAQIFNKPSDGVIETFRRFPNGHIPRLSLHQKRFEKATGHNLSESLDEVRNRRPELDARVRLVSRNGTVETQISPYTDMNAPLSLALSRYELSEHVQDMSHKTTARDFYEGEYARIHALSGSDEVIFMNKDGHICEGSFTSIFVEIDGTLRTPNVTSGLLSGVFRQDLIDSGKVEEMIITLEDLKKANEIFVGNSLRGLMPAIFADFLLH